MSASFTRTDAPLTLVLLHYVAPLEAIDAALADHVAWLTAAYDRGVVLASGRRVPRTGGVILFRGDRATVEAAVAGDPFVARGLAEAELVPFTAGMAAPALAELLA